MRTILFLLACVAACAAPDAGFDPAAFDRVQPDLFETPGAQSNSWIDYDGDGDLDLFVGMRYTPNLLYRNDGGRFVDVAAEVGLANLEVTRAGAWGDYDGDLDLFVALRDQPNRMFRNDGAPGDGGGGAAWIFTDVTAESGIGDPRRAVGVAWFDYDRDGDLDVHVSNQNGDEDAFYRNNGDGTFTDVTDPATLGVDYHSTSAVWGDADHNGLPDLVVTSYLSGIASVEDHLFMNAGGGRFHNALPANLLEHGPSHGVAWADFDGDGDLDLSIANNHEPGGTHHLYRNLLDAGAAARSLQVVAVDATGRSVVPGAEVQLLDPASGRLLGTRLIDTGGGYCSQGAAPAHFGLPPGVERVDVRVTFVADGRRSTVVREGVLPADYQGRWLIVPAVR